MSWELSSFLPLASCRSPSETDLLPTVDPGGCWRCCCFFCCWVFFVCVVLFLSVFFNNRSTLNFFCLNALWSEGEFLSTYEVRDVCYRWHRWLDGFLYGREKNTHIWNICRMHMKNFTGNAHHIWILTEVKETRSMKRINQLRSIRSYLPVILEKCFVIRGQDVGEC